LIYADKGNTGKVLGFVDEKSQKSMEIEQEIKNSLGYDYYENFTSDTSFYNVSWAYSLLPIWVCKFKYKKKFFNFMINGKTGNIKGKTPKSGWKIFSLVAGILAGIGYYLATVVSYEELDAAVESYSAELKYAIVALAVAAVLYLVYKGVKK